MRGTVILVAFVLMCSLFLGCAAEPEPEQNTLASVLASSELTESQLPPPPIPGKSEENE
jgi:hypothetical protein|tara:strand:+ start:970 stop:1146 length:177 start_codon:yes stop_codon:yes gene_type:complete